MNPEHFDSDDLSDSQPRVTRHYYDAEGRLIRTEDAEPTGGWQFNYTYEWRDEDNDDEGEEWKSGPAEEE